MDNMNRWLTKFTVTVNWRKRRHKIESEAFKVRKETDSEFHVMHDDTITTEVFLKEDLENFILLNQINDLRDQVRSSIQDFDFKSKFKACFWVAGNEIIPEYYYGDFILLAIKHDLLVKSWERRKQGKSY